MTEEPVRAERPNKSARKRELRTLQGLAESMSTLSRGQLEQLDVEPGLIDALMQLREMPRSGARNRHLRYCVKQLDGDDLDQVRAFLEDQRSQRVSINQAFHAVEQWRDRLIAEGDGALQQLIEAYPKVDRQQLRALWRDAVREEDKGKPAGAARKLFRFLRELMV